MANVTENTTITDEAHLDEADHALTAMRRLKKQVAVRSSRNVWKPHVRTSTGRTSGAKHSPEILLQGLLLGRGADMDKPTMVREALQLLGEAPATGLVASWVGSG
jgi:hypothetical protein